MTDDPAFLLRQPTLLGEACLMEPEDRLAEPFHAFRRQARRDGLDPFGARA